MIEFLKNIRYKERLKTLEEFRGGDVAIQGSYGGSNVGDNMLGETIRNYIESEGRKCTLFGHPHKNFSRWRYLVVGGGGIIYPDSEGNLEYRMSAVESAKNFSVHGVGVPRLDERAEGLLDSLEEADKITVRDKFSKDNLAEFIDSEIRVTVDPVFSRYNGYEATNSSIIGVNFKSISKKRLDSFKEHYNLSNDVDFEEANKQYKEYCRALWEKVNEDNRAEFIPFELEDKDFAKEIGIESSNIRELMSPNDKIDHIGENISKMVCTRYHSLIFSLITGTPVNVISYAPKVSNLCERVGIERNLFYELSKNEVEPNFEQVSEDKIKSLHDEAIRDFENLIGCIKATSHSDFEK